LEAESQLVTRANLHLKNMFIGSRKLYFIYQNERARAANLERGLLFIGHYEYFLHNLRASLAFFLFPRGVIYQQTLSTGQCPAWVRNKNLSSVTSIATSSVSRKVR